MSVKVDALFKELDNFLQREEYDNAAQTADKSTQELTHNSHRQYSSKIQTTRRLSTAKRSV